MLRKVLSRGLSLIALIAVGGYFVLFPPLPRPPEIARGLPSNFAEADEKFARRILAALPPPLTLEELIARLGEQGFTVNEEAEYAVFEKSKFPCALRWPIHWEVKDGSVSNLNSKYRGACL